ncbi:MAG: agmatine deiminase family protein [Kofleriaceae bacterium]
MTTAQPTLTDSHRVADQPRYPRGLGFSLLTWVGLALASGACTEAPRVHHDDPSPGGKSDDWTSFQGFIPETFSSSAVVMANAENFVPLLQLQVELIKSLPEDVTAYVLSAAGNPYQSVLAEQLADGRLVVIDVPTDSNWARDYVPQVVRRDGELTLVTFQYQAGYPLAQTAARELSSMIGLPVYESPLLLEGGNLMSDEDGRLFTTDRLLEANPSLTKEAIEAELIQALGVNEVVWLPALPYESTGHIDMFAKFAGGNRVLVSDSLHLARKPVLDQVATTFGELGYEVTRVMAGELDGSNLWNFSYTNSLFVNGRVFVPTYASTGTSDEENAHIAETDVAAVATYEALGFEAVPVASGKLLYYGGSVHCLTKQLAADVPAPMPR